MCDGKKNILYIGSGLYSRKKISNQLEKEPKINLMLKLEEVFKIPTEITFKDLDKMW